MKKDTTKNKPKIAPRFLEPRKSPSGSHSTPCTAEEKDENDLGGQQEDHLKHGEEQTKKKQAAKNAAWDKILMEKRPSEEEDEEDEDADWDDEEGDADEDADVCDEDSGDTATEDEVAPVAMGIATAADHINAYVDRLKERRTKASSRGLVGASTGLPQLDEATSGFQQITFIAGKPEAGKTSLATQTCIAALRHDQKLAVVYFLMDDNMTWDDLFDQMVCSEARVDYKKLTEGILSLEEKKTINNAIGRLKQEVMPRMVILDGFQNEHGRGVTGEDIFTFCQDSMRQVGAERVLVVLDMLNDLPHPKVSGNWEVDWLPTIRRIEGDPDRWRLEQVVDLEDRSRRVCPGGWPILALCQLRKLEGKGREPDLDDFLGGVALGYKCKRAFILIRDTNAGPCKSVVPVTLVTKKARHGEMIRLPLLFHHTQFRFEEVKTSTRQGNKTTRKESRSTSENRSASSSSFDPLAGME